VVTFVDPSELPERCETCCECAHRMRAPTQSRLNELGDRPHPSPTAPSSSALCPAVSAPDPRHPCWVPSYHPSKRTVACPASSSPTRAESDVRPWDPAPARAVRASVQRVGHQRAHPCQPCFELVAICTVEHAVGVNRVDGGGPDQGVGGGAGGSRLGAGQGRAGRAAS
jgi:hypothetical protein